MAGPLDRVYHELAPDIRRLRTSCLSRALLPLKDLISFLQRLSACRSEERALVVVEAPEVHCFLALQDLSQGEGTHGLNQIQLQVVEALCAKGSGGQAPPVAACRRTLRTIFFHFGSNEISLKNTVKLLSECAKEGWWDVARLIVGRLCGHLKVADLGAIEQKVLGTLRDSLVQYGVSILVKIVNGNEMDLQALVLKLPGGAIGASTQADFSPSPFLMAQGSAPELGNLPPAVKWYLRFLRKCSGKVVSDECQEAARKIKRSDLDFLFWPFMTSVIDSKGSIGLPYRTSCKEARDWSSRFGLEIQSWRDNLLNLICTELRILKSSSFQGLDDELCYNWLPFAEYMLNPDEWIWLHDLLLHSSSSVKDLETRLEKVLQTSGMDSKPLRLGAVLVEVLAQETRIRSCCQILGIQQRPTLDSGRKHEDHVVNCCGCIHQDVRTGKTKALLIWLMRDASNNTWTIIFKNLLVAALSTRDAYAFQSYQPCDELLFSRLNFGLVQKDRIPLRALDSTLITLVQNEKDLLLERGMKEADQFSIKKQAKGSEWRVVEVIWPALLSQMSYHNFSFTYHRILEILETFCLSPSHMEDDLPEEDSPFPDLELHTDLFLELVKLEPRYIVPLMKYLKPGSKLAAINCIKQGGSKQPSTQDLNLSQLDLFALQEGDYIAAIHNCVLQSVKQMVQQLDVLLLRVASFSGGSFRFLFGECGDALDTSELINARKSGNLSNASIFGKSPARKKGNVGTARLVTAFEGRLLLCWQLEKWAEDLQRVSYTRGKKHLPELENFKKFCSQVSGLHIKFPRLDSWAAVGLTAISRALSVQAEDASWVIESLRNEDGEAVRSAKRPRLSPFVVGEEKGEPEWIVEALCRSPASLETHLLAYLGLNVTKGLRPARKQGVGSTEKAQPEPGRLHRQNLVAYLAKHPFQIPNLASSCRSKEVLHVACDAIQEAATINSTSNESDIFELWFQFLEHFREIDSITRRFSYLDEGTILTCFTECALCSAVISSWPRDLLQILVSESPGMICRLYGEAQRHIKNGHASQDSILQDLKDNSSDSTFSGVVLAIDANPKAVAVHLESTLVALHVGVGMTPELSDEISSLLDLLSIVFARCKPVNRSEVLSQLSNSSLHKTSITQVSNTVVSEAPLPDTFVSMVDDPEDEMLPTEKPILQLWASFALSVILWRTRILEDLKNTFETPTDLITRNQHDDFLKVDQRLSLSVQRAAICHVLATSKPQLRGNPRGDGQSSQTYGPCCTASCEEMILKLQALAPVENYTSLYHAIKSWILLLCKMSIRLNLEHILAFCRLHPSMFRDYLIKQIEEEIVEASKMEGDSLSWKRSLQELKAGLYQGLLAWLPLDARSHFTTTNVVPSGFWLEINNKGVQEVLSCLGGHDVGVRRSAFYFVVAHRHQHQFIFLLTLELYKKVIAAELSGEQEALLEMFLPVLKNNSNYTAFVTVDSVVILLEKARNEALSFQASGEESNVTYSSEKQQRVKALLRVALLACKTSPHTFATGNIALLLMTLAKVQTPSEEIVVGAMRCLGVLAVELQVTVKHVKAVQDLLLHLVYKPADDYVWLLAMTFAEGFAAGLTDPPDHKEALSGAFEESPTRTLARENLFYRCPLQRSVPLQAMLQRLDSLLPCSHQT